VGALSRGAAQDSGERDPQLKGSQIGGETETGDSSVLSIQVHLQVPGWELSNQTLWVAALLAISLLLQLSLYTVLSVRYGVKTAALLENVLTTNSALFVALLVMLIQCLSKEE